VGTLSLWSSFHVASSGQLQSRRQQCLWEWVPPAPGDGQCPVCAPNRGRADQREHGSGSPDLDIIVYVRYPNALSEQPVKQKVLSEQPVNENVQREQPVKTTCQQKQQFCINFKNLARFSRSRQFIQDQDIFVRPRPSYFPTVHWIFGCLDRLSCLLLRHLPHLQGTMEEL
jgi:hypothetical protein